MAKSLDLELSSSQYVWCADNANVSITSNITIEGWVKFEQLPSTAGSNFRLVTKLNGAANKVSYGSFIDISNKLNAQFSDDGTTDNTHYVVFTTDAAAFDTVNKWYYYGITFDLSSETCIFYVGDQLTTPTSKASSLTTGSTIGASLHDNDSDFSIGARKDTGTEFFDGKLDEKRLWNVVRSQADIQANYKKNISTNANLKGYWKFDGNYTDSSGNGSTLTAQASPILRSDVPFGGGNSLFLQQI